MDYAEWVVLKLLSVGAAERHSSLCSIIEERQQNENMLKRSSYGNLHHPYAVEITRDSVTEPVSIESFNKACLQSYACIRMGLYILRPAMDLKYFHCRQFDHTLNNNVLNPHCKKESFGRDLFIRPKSYSICYKISTWIFLSTTIGTLRLGDWVNRPPFHLHWSPVGCWPVLAWLCLTCCPILRLKQVT